MDPNRLYNRIVDLLCFIVTVLFIVGKVLNWFDVSWWWILIPIFLPDFFHVTEYVYVEEDDEDGEEFKPWWRK